MASKKLKVEDVKLDAAVVGAGPSGLKAFQGLRAEGKDVLLIEAGPSVGGRSRRALHLLNVAQSEKEPLVTSEMLNPLQVRWEREWVSFEEVNWKSSDWVAFLPQWQKLATGLHTVLLELPLAAQSGAEIDAADKNDEEIAGSFLLNSPVSAVTREESGWVLQTPVKRLHCGHVVWAAGLKPFQNAYGKQEAQRVLRPNEDYEMSAADFQGGVGLDVDFSRVPEWADGFPKDSLFGLPTRFEGKFHLLIGAVVEHGKGCSLRTLTHAHQDLLSDPKLVSSFQKAIRRTLKTVFQEADTAFEGAHELWTVSDRVMGHSLGMNSLLPPQLDEAFEFVGDEVDGLKFDDTVGALESVDLRSSKSTRAPMVSPA